MSINTTSFRIEKDNLLSEINKQANINNIKKWDLGSFSSKDLSVQVDQGESKQLKGSHRNSLTIRVWNKQNKLGITTTSDISNLGIKKAFEIATAASHFGNFNDIPTFSVLAKDKLSNNNSIIRESVGIKKLLEILKQAESDLIKSNKSINSVPYNGLAEANIERLYINSEDAYRQMQLTQASLYLYAKCQEKGRKPRSAGSLKTAYGITDLDINSCITESSNKVISHLDYLPIKTDKYLVCFAPEAFLELITSFSSMFNARLILDGLSISNKESLGNSIAVPFLSIFDNALHKDNICSFNFDGEATPKRNLILVKDGIIENFLHSESTARKFDVEPTGHASLGAKAGVSPEWIVIKKTNKSTCKMNSLSFQDTKEKFVLIDNLNALHAGIKATQGSFSLPFDGWLIENGVKKSIEAATVAGDIRYLLNNIIQVEDNQVLTNSGISPHVWVQDLSITGEA